MRILALIPARGGSKRLPGKNIRLLGGRPLIERTIDIVNNLSQICEVLISTDDPAIAVICKAAGANVPWLRPFELSTDTASSVDVALHALDWYESEKGAVDGLLLLQPTSPYRTRETVLTGIGLFQEHGRTVIAVSEVKVHPSRCFSIVRSSIRPYCQKDNHEEPAYAANGSFYLISPNSLRKNRAFFDVNTVPIIINSPKESLDIDTELDWVLAENLLEK
ncbi:MAG: acylneuraminate cytidylyltransferase family protein [Undibacterium sp.]|uniref:acylneuraminate cytidylyltransferase family protein n=1 Tax=Undibacterium sp. TaxID=1914977 RepID=UPI00271CDADE|nr:acylneuraminate cytidylyltransferase family protein [Undibacterium sp.]MDO8652473.1 acylneuraminate cytidylyltransferase family protein [Undibacterium sp.]